MSSSFWPEGNNSQNHGWCAAEPRFEAIRFVHRPSGGSRGSRPWACPRGWEGERGGSRMCGHRHARARGSAVRHERRTCLHRGRRQRRALWHGQESQHRRTRGVGAKGRRRGVVRARDATAAPVAKGLRRAWVAAAKAPRVDMCRHDQPLREGPYKRAPRETPQVGALALDCLQESAPLALRHPALPVGTLKKAHPGTLRGSLEGRRSLN
jgi:hypothetical protein